MATLNATKIVVDTTGVYNRLIKHLMVNGYYADPGDVVFVLHPDENKALYIPRNKATGNYQLFLNHTTLEFVKEEMKSDVHTSMVALLEERSKESGYYVIWSDEYTCNLIPTPTIKKSSTKGFG